MTLSEPTKARTACIGGAGSRRAVTSTPVTVVGELDGGSAADTAVAAATIIATKAFNTRISVATNP
jgi:hypothetical protein